MTHVCELREGIGLCDSCSLPKWPQEDMGYGHMVCLDCLTKERNLRQMNGSPDGAVNASRNSVQRAAGLPQSNFAGGGTSGQGLGGEVSSKGATGHSAVPSRWVASGLQAVASNSIQGRWSK